MKKAILLLLGFFLCVGCSKGGEEEKSQTTPPPPTSLGAQASSTAHAATATPAPGGQLSQPAPTAPIFMTTSPAQTSDLIQKRKDLLLIDVRSPQELREGAIEGSTLLPFWNIMKGEFDLPKERPILLICAVGGRSYAAGQILAQKGYKEIYNLQGGIDAWKRAGLPLKY
jgi:rhodanese-related sulfurtransferase